MSEKMLRLEYFPELFLGQKTYRWQHEVLHKLGLRGSRVALKAANGSGKTSSIVAPAILWHMIRFEGGETVVTAGAYRQLTEVLWPLLRTKTNGLGGTDFGWEVTENRIRYKADGWKEPSHCYAFSAADPDKAEGRHARGPNINEQHLLYIIDEGKSVSDLIYEKLERSQPTRVLITSSPGGRSGAFYRIFNPGDDRYDTFTVSAYDCPHISKELIAEQIKVYGEGSQLIQSMIYGEFGDEEGHSLILAPSVLQKNIANPPTKEGNQLWGFCDFAAGGDENVLCVREGNAVKHLITWREKDTMAAVGRFLTEFKRHGLDANHTFGDAGGIGIPMCDAIREAGFDIRRVNNGEAAFNPDHFANRGTEMWVQYARMVETCKVVVPADETLHRQLTTRRLEHNSKGKLIAEPKEKMAKRGLGSPDRADAVVGAFCAMGQSMEQLMAGHGRRVSFSDLDDMADNEHSLEGCHAG